MPTIAEAILEGARRLEQAGESEARRTAGLLLAYRLRVDRTHLLTHPEQAISAEDRQAFLQMIERRAAGEPVQYITEHQEFYGRDFLVTPAVLIPRPETEFLIERVLALVRDMQQAAPLIVDLGTGSGCIAVTLAVELPAARIIATDISGAALEVARQNVAQHGVSARIEFYEGDLLAPLIALGLDNRVDILASNPPYVAENQPEMVQRDVREFEPHGALFGGADGLNFYRRLLVEAFSVVRPGGFLVCEIGYSQLDAIAEMVAASHWQLVEIIHDLQGIARTLVIRKTPEGARRPLLDE
ncbi:MAG: peptide chain release factor N(5)-glutamine methyltransferase [Blastocatellia bacterium]